MSPASPPDPTVRVLTFNLGSLLEPDWDRRRHLVVAGLDRLAPDVVCFQEAWESDDEPATSAWVAEAAAGVWHHAFGGFDVELQGRFVRFGSAVLSRWPIEQHEVHRLPLGPAPDPMLERVGWELLHARTAGLDLFSAHLAPAPHQTLDRQAQVLAIDSIIKATRGSMDDTRNLSSRSPMPPILCGDFNAEPQSDEMRFLAGFTALEGRATFYQDAWRVAGDGSTGFTNDWQLSDLAAMLNVHRKRIDYVWVGDPFVRAGRGGRVLSAEVVLGAPDGSGLSASDHCGVLAEIVWPDRPAD